MHAEMDFAERAESEGARGGSAKAATVVVEHPKSSEEDIIARDTGAGAETEPLQTSHQTTAGAEHNFTCSTIRLMTHCSNLLQQAACLAHDH